MVENLQKNYFSRDISVFKTSISVSDLARWMLFDTGCQAGASFALFDEANSDLYHAKWNLTGGPSIMFHRHHEVGLTYMRNDLSKPCQKIVGFDANTLYLWCIDQQMLIGPFV